MAAYAFNSSTGGRGADLCVPGQPGFHSDIVRPCLKEKNKNKKRRERGRGRKEGRGEKEQESRRNWADEAESWSRSSRTLLSRLALLLPHHGY